MATSFPPNDDLAVAYPDQLVVAPSCRISLIDAPLILRIYVGDKITPGVTSKFYGTLVNCFVNCQSNLEEILDNVEEILSCHDLARIKDARSI